ncbi:hypothetical protein CRUP_022443, partial [Coryphaenoides rupestris]
FAAESEGQKEAWLEALQESIAEALCDYEVADKIWSNGANRACADCGAPRPEWASINLGVVICKKCAVVVRKAATALVAVVAAAEQEKVSRDSAGDSSLQGSLRVSAPDIRAGGEAGESNRHRSLGPSISKVRSLKLDSSVWSNELVELFLEVGNGNANQFWAAHVPLEEELSVVGVSPEQRATFLRRKYRERKYCRPLVDGLRGQEQLNQVTQDHPQRHETLDERRD